MTVRPNALVDAFYLRYAILAFDLVKGLYGLGEGVRQSLTFDEIKKIKFPVPPLDEQKVIAESLSKKWAVIDEVVDKYKDQIKQLEALKRAMIYEYAVGKKTATDVSWR